MHLVKIKLLGMQFKHVLNGNQGIDYSPILF